MRPSDRDRSAGRGGMPAPPRTMRTPTPEMPFLPDTPGIISEWWEELPEELLKRPPVRPVQLVPIPQEDHFIDQKMEQIALLETMHMPAVTTLHLPAIKGAQAPGANTEKRKVVASTAGGAAIAGVGDMLSAVLRYATNVVMTHLVAQNIYGVFVETSTMVTVLGYASKLGMDSTALRFLATYRARGLHMQMVGLIRFASFVALGVGIICALCFFVLSRPIAQLVYHSASYILPFKEATLLIPLIGMQLVVASGLQALRAIKWKVYVDRLIQPGITLVLLIVFYLLGWRLEALIFASICGYLASTLIGQILLHLRVKRVVGAAPPRYEPGAWLRFAFPMFFNSLIRNVLNSTDILFLGAVTTASQVGLYGAADRVSYFVVAPLLALNVIFSPIIAELHARNKHVQLTSLFKVVTKWSFSLSWPMFLCCVLFHQEILAVFGEHYTAAGLVLMILAFGNLVDAGVGSVNYLLVMTGRPRIILLNTLSSVCVNIVLAVLLVPRLGIVGAALSAACTVILLNLVGLIEVYWIMHMHPYRMDILKPMLAGGVASLVGLLLTRVLPANSGYLALLETLGMVAGFAVVYVALLAVLRFSEEDMMVFATLRTRLGKQT